MRLADIIGSALIASAVTVPLSCLPSAEKQNLQPLVAAAGAYALMQPDANPSPPTDGKCQNCNGVGRVSDGRVSVVCPVCDGTGDGKATKKTPASASTQTPRATPCATGNCPLPTRTIVR